MIVICDIDGVIANPCRLVEEYLIKDNKWNWEEYYKHSLEIPGTPVLSIINGLLDTSNKVYFVTGRPESDRDQTSSWLLTNLSKLYWVNPDILIMRREGDIRKSLEIKLDICKKLNPSLVLEDESEAVEELVSHGYIVLQVHGFRATKKDGIPGVKYV